MRAAEGVGEPGVEQLGELLAFLIGKARISTVGAGVLQVDLVMRHVEIAAHDHRLRLCRFTRLRQRKPLRGQMPVAHGSRFRDYIRAVFAFTTACLRAQHHVAIGAGTFHRNACREHTLFQALAKVAERVIPFHAMIDTRQLVLRVRRVNANEPILGKFARHDAAFGIQMGKAQAMKHLQRLFLCENRRTGIALLLRIAPKLAILRQIKRRLTRLQLRFLQRDDIGIELAHDILEALLQNGAQTVHVPRNHPHREAPPSQANSFRNSIRSLGDAGKRLTTRDTPTKPRQITTRLQVSYAWRPRENGSRHRHVPPSGRRCDRGCWQSNGDRAKSLFSQRETTHSSLKPDT